MEFYILRLKLQSIYILSNIFPNAVGLFCLSYKILSYSWLCSVHYACLVSLISQPQLQAETQPSIMLALLFRTSG